MPKIEMKTTLKTKENLIETTVLALRNNNHYSYLENGFTVVIDICDSCVKMLRKKDEYELEFLFKENEDSVCNIHLGNNSTCVPIVTKKVDIAKTKIFIVYAIDNEEFQYLIQM